MLVTFDAAGTLIDHRWDPAGIAKRAAEECGLSVVEDEARIAYRVVEKKYRDELVALERSGERGAVKALWQRQMADWLTEVGHHASDAPRVLEEFRNYAFRQGSSIWMLFDDARPAIQLCRERGATVGVVSNWDHTLHAVLRMLGIAAEFDFVIASLEFGHEKPDVRIFDEALRLANKTPEQAIHIGDRYEDDFVGASAAGWTPLHLDRDLEPDPANNRISSLVQVEAWLP